MDDVVKPDLLERRLADRLRGLRQGCGLTLEQLAGRSGVSRAAISLIERGESSPTANLLDRLAGSLGVSLASLFSEPPRADADPLARHANQPLWTDPASFYRRRNLSPPAFPSALELSEIVLPAGTRVSYDTAMRTAVTDQQIWLLEGTLEVAIGDAVHRLAEGDCLAMRLDRPTGFHNPGETPARYLVAITAAGSRAAAGRPA
jgi:transcriptional regulator with XRE-family HTH domain